MASAVAGAHLIERALHDPHNWEIGWGPFRVPAIRQVLHDKVVFTATFPSSFGSYEPLLSLYVDGELQSVRAVPAVDDEGRETGSVPFEVRWELAVGQQPIAA